MNDLHPFDFEALNPGDVLTVEQLELFTGHKKGTTAYQHAVLVLKDRIRKERLADGRPIELKQVKGELKICNTSEQLQLAANAAKATKRKSTRTIAILITTRVVELSEQELKKFELLTVNAAARHASMSKNSIKRLVSSPKKQASNASALPESASESPSLKSA